MREGSRFSLSLAAAIRGAGFPLSCGGGRGGAAAAAGVRAGFATAVSESSRISETNQWTQPIYDTLLSYIICYHIRTNRCLTRKAGAYHEHTSAEQLTVRIYVNGEPTVYTSGTLMQRVVYHYWYHTGENMAIRQLLGQAELPEFVGDIDVEAPYRPH
jgi:hypothetical protein